ncbi:MAG TPA: efflux RND transporter periplasmic adaptor subunit [Cyclobacteriaceae bacterium]|nr:efflux RND transporter periplasmic adaptor subunit [Cyclobacteriaceae bacterium]
MKAKLYTSILAVAAIAVILAGCSAASGDKKSQLEKLKTQQAKTAAEIKKLEDEILKENPGSASVKMKDVTARELNPRPFDYFVQTQGSVEAVDNILVSARTAGIITQVFVKEGDVVTAGQTLAQIDNTITLRSIEEAKSGLELANTVYERQKNLWDQKIGTEVQYLQAKNAKQSIEKRLAILNEQLEMARIKSPISGSIDEVSLKIGQNAAPGLPAFRVVSNNRLKVKANVSEAYVTAIKKGNKVSVNFSDVNKTLEANVTFVGRTINQLSRTFPIEVALPSNEELRPNMTGVLRIIFDSKNSALVVPVNIVQDVNGQKIVYVAEQDGNNLVAKRKVVEVSGVYNNQAEIISGLKAGDKIITVGYQGLNDGELVRM